MRRCAGGRSASSRHGATRSRTVRPRYAIERTDVAARFHNGFGGQNVAAYRDERGDTTLRSAICTHMDCIVGWNDAERHRAVCRLVVPEADDVETKRQRGEHQNIMSMSCKR
jgi:hypothetical protein